MLTLYHGSPFLFKEFEFQDRNESLGIKYGCPIFLTDMELLAAMWSHKAGAKDHYLYTVQIPDLTPENHLRADVQPSIAIIKRIEDLLHETIPADAKSSGKALKNWLYARPSNSSSDYEHEKEVVDLMDDLGIIAYAYQMKDTKGVYHYSVHCKHLRIVKCEHINPKFEREADGKSHLHILDRQEV